ncbi:hypothetical protein, partial [Escherichia coli]
MTGKETIQTIISDIRKARDDGIKQLDINGLLKYLEGFKEDEGLSHDFQLETLKANHQINVEAFKAKEGANKRGNSSRLTQSFHFFMFEPI